jgi:polynucleotide 5'-kinase involved in rRNA processing
VWLCVEEIPRRRDPAAVQELFGRRRIAFTPAGTFHNLLVGLIGADGHLLDLGLLRGINFERGLFSVLTPVRVPADVCVMQLGRIRLNPDGQELGRVRPGEL